MGYISDTETGTGNPAACTFVNWRGSLAFMVFSSFFYFNFRSLTFPIKDGGKEKYDKHTPNLSN